VVQDSDAHRNPRLNLHATVVHNAKRIAQKDCVHSSLSIPVEQMR
jgi:hypothetical protein